MAYFLPLHIHGNVDHGGSFVEWLDGLLAWLETLAAQGPGGEFGMWLPGVSAMSNIHPLLVHFPIALLTVFFGLDSIGMLFKKNVWRQAANPFLYLGTVAAAATVAAGWVAAETVAHGGNVHAIMERHEHIGIAILVLASVLSLWRFKTGVQKGVLDALFLSMNVLLCVLIVLGADLGGLMVYQYGVAVKAVPLSSDASGHQHAGHE